MYLHAPSSEKSVLRYASLKESATETVFERLSCALLCHSDQLCRRRLFPVAGGVARLPKAQSLQLRPGRAACLPAATPSVGPQFGSSFGAPTSAVDGHVSNFLAILHRLWVLEDIDFKLFWRFALCMSDPVLSWFARPGRRPAYWSPLPSVILLW